jgi:hypothetical protein
MIGWISSVWLGTATARLSRRTRKDAKDAEGLRLDEPPNRPCHPERSRGICTSTTDQLMEKSLNQVTRDEVMAFRFEGKGSSCRDWT